MSNLRAILSQHPSPLALKILKEPNRRPPVLAEMMPDINRVISSIANKYTDQSCQFLHTDNLEAEGRFKLAKVIHGGWLKKITNRAEFFKFIKAVVNNFIKGLVQRHRYTIKRTGLKPPKRGELPVPGEEPVRTKNVEVSLNDPDSGVQIEDQSDSSGIGVAAESEWMQDVLPLLTATEKLVLTQVTEPNREALILAQLDASRGKVKKCIVIRTHHQAEGIGMNIEQFQAVLDGIQVKVKRYMSEEEDYQYNAALAKLSELFELYIPKNFDKAVVKRLLTLAARDQAAKVTPEIAKILDQVGAKAPQYIAGQLNCFGILYEKHNRICSSCGLKVACATEAANVGLGEITLAPTLLGPKSTRIPALMHRPISPTDTPQFLSDRDEHLFEYLEAHFDRVPHRGEIYFRMRDLPGQREARSEAGGGLGVQSGMYGLVFSFDENQRLRFCKASEAIKPELQQRKNAFYLHDDSSEEEAMSLINKHAQEYFAEATP